MDDIDIREASLDDVIGIVYVQATFWIANYSSDENGIGESDIRSIDFKSKIRDWQHMIQSPNYQVAVAGRTDKITGVIAVRRDAGENEIYERCILPKAQPPELAQRLLEKALEWFEPSDPIKVRIISYDQAGVAFYQQFGFRISELGEVDFIRLPSGKNIPTLEMHRGAVSPVAAEPKAEEVSKAPAPAPLADEPTEAPDKLISRAKLAKLSKTRPSTIKYYTEIGLLPFEQADNRLARRYDSWLAVKRLEYIQQLRKQGYSIKEIIDTLSTH